LGRTPGSRPSDHSHSQSPTCTHSYMIYSVFPSSTDSHELPHNPPSPTPTVVMSTNAMLAAPPGECCIKTVQHEGTPVGTFEALGGVSTYVGRPPGALAEKYDRVMLFFSDVYSSLYINNQLLCDYFAAQGTTGKDMSVWRFTDEISHAQAFWCSHPTTSKATRCTSIARRTIPISTLQRGSPRSACERPSSCHRSSRRRKESTVRRITRGF
jgi:hypothetical protein